MKPSHYRFSAPAKINLALRIVGRRGDGYHLLWTVMTFFPLFDTLEITVPSPILSLECFPKVTVSEEHNLVLKAAKLLKKESGTSQGALLKLTKNIPHGGGLGGGSSDAATTLMALNKLWGLHLSLADLIQMGVKLGADVPIFLGGQAALAEGIGERLTPLPHLATPHLVVVNPGITLPTQRVFQALAKQGLPKTDSHALPNGYQKDVSPLLVNDLEAIAIQLEPTIGQIALELQQLGAIKTLMSGSGSSLFGLFADSDHAERATKHLKQTHFGWKIFSGQTFNIHPFSNE